MYMKQHISGFDSRASTRGNSNQFVGVERALAARDWLFSNPATAYYGFYGVFDLASKNA
jgi:hypothetical protein